MKQGGGTIDTNALANGRGLSTGSPSVAPVWNSTATVKTSTPTSYIPSYTSWYPTAHQDTMQQPQLMWTRTAKTTPPLYPPTAQFRGPDTGQSLCGLPHTGTPQPRPDVKTDNCWHTGQRGLNESRPRRRRGNKSLFELKGMPGKWVKSKLLLSPFPWLFVV